MKAGAVTEVSRNPPGRIGIAFRECLMARNQIQRNPPDGKPVEVKWSRAAVEHLVRDARAGAHKYALHAGCFVSRRYFFGESPSMCRACVTRGNRRA